MRWSFFIPATVFGSIALGQWEAIPIELPVGIGMEGPGTVGSGVMIGPGTGFWTTSVMLSPSSGSSTTIYATNDDWQTYSSVQSFSNMNSITLVPGASPNSILMYFYYPNVVASVRRTSSYWETDWLELYGGSGPAIEAFNDSSCWVATRLTPGPVRLEKRMPDEVVLIHEFGMDVQTIDQVTFVDELNGAVVEVGVDGTRSIQVSSTGGVEWNTVYSQANEHLRVSMTSPDTLWAIGGEGLLIRSSDRGASWEQLSPPGDMELSSIAVCSWDSIWVAGSNGYAAVTGNGGATWLELPIPLSGEFTLKAVPGIIYASAYGALFKYSDRQSSGPAGGWRSTDQGIEILLGGGGPYGSISIWDSCGRVLSTGGAGPIIPMYTFAEGLYIVQVRMLEEEFRMKVYWPGR